MSLIVSYRNTEALIFLFLFFSRCFHGFTICYK
jgi:hypothetical protein